MPAGEKLYVLDMFHIRVAMVCMSVIREGYKADITCALSECGRKSVLHPMGYDAFGLPAEEHAIKTNTPREDHRKKHC